MSEIIFARIDYRLIHGQVITKWIRQSNADKITIIDDATAKDSFLLSIYAMAAPPGYSVNIYSVEDAIVRWHENTFTEGKVFILFKDISSAYRAITQGLPIRKIQIGGLGFAPGRKNVYGAISLDDADARMLDELSRSGVEVFFQQVPDETSSSLAKVFEKHKFNISKGEK